MIEFSQTRWYKPAVSRIPWRLTMPENPDTGNYPTIKSLSSEQQKYIFETLRKEAEYRRDKAWKIFSWASTILLAVIGGVIALATNPNPNERVVLPWYPHRILLLAAVTILAAYSILWVERNLSVEHSIFDEIRAYEVRIGIRRSDGLPPERFFEKVLRVFGYRETIGLLAIAAIASIVLI